MSFGQAWDDAGAIITLLALIPAFFIVLVMVLNIGNPEFDMISAFEAGMGAIAGAMMPALVVTSVLALIIYVVNSGR